MILLLEQPILLFIIATYLLAQMKEKYKINPSLFQNKNYFIVYIFKTKKNISLIFNNQFFLISFTVEGLNMITLNVKT